MLLKTISYSATQPNTGGAAAGIGSDTLVVENDRSATQPEIIDWWGFNQTAGFHQIIRPNSAMETTRDMRIRIPAANPLPQLSRGMRIPVAAQETLAITVSGSNTAGDVEIGAYTVLYRQLSGMGRYLDWSTLQRRGFNIQSVDFSIATSAAGYTSQTGATWGTLLKANMDYAVLGFVTSAAQAGVAILGPDSGNVGYGMPGVVSDPQWSAGYYGELSRMHGDLECIPTFNSGNVANTSIRVTVNETAPTVVGTMWIVPLK